MPDIIQEVIGSSSCTLICESITVGDSITSKVIEYRNKGANISKYFNGIIVVVMKKMDTDLAEYSDSEVLINTMGLHKPSSSRTTISGNLRPIGAS